MIGRDLASLIVGHKPAEVAEFESKLGAALERDRQRRAELQRDMLWRIAAYLVPFLLILSGGMARYRQRKRQTRDLQSLN